MIENTTITPPTAPIIVASPGVGAKGSAVIETRPAIAPLSAIVKSDLPNNTLDTINAPITPPAAAKFVFTNINDTAFASATFDTINSDPPLNPNQPNHNINVPNVASGKFAPGIAFTLPSTYLPFLEPSTKTPARAAVAPHK